ncbi:NAD(P)-dependent glycerol-3-phosphate dehydrogenase [Corynebacterium sp. zg-331]|uniref:NAD(P)H-dependent glycerol-3-phosphate dehydrogenase n=1 Tax=unclassified Corynebacterium TaxID=2624378 RepID=UPI00128C34DF|nr:MULTISPECIES: NAD(P)H-dependent glycerol-3-phosphate dehydrogenase [unclassified Corynebacterium]MBC3186260.1 NAD(P)-dependent glycerol-3-phosphate dehydrogenase [Corynebacterium sp. zg-331]MPV52747.1 NAD(P)H-dependent glycerol-3-phosphate dehydrogenase [Corynebacterium sp. zg331]
MVAVAVMGAGSWGTTLAKVFADAGNSVRLWARREEVARAINAEHRNRDYLPDTVLPRQVQASADPRWALDHAQIVVLGVPSQTLRANLAQWGSAIPARSTVVSISKGVEMGTGMLMNQVIEDAGIESGRIAVLTGPNLAREIAQEQVAATVIACSDTARAVEVQQAVSTQYLRPYTNSDVVGCEVGGACKNVIAVACGITTGLGMGYNTLATVITRGLAEITRLGQALGAQPRTLSGLAGLGDLVATCSSSLSRNHRFGARLGAGGSMEEARNATGGQVAEGVVSSTSIAQLARRYSVDMPITQAVHAVCHDGMSVEAMMSSLMERSKKAEY